jgi:hypothetical protein
MVAHAIQEPSRPSAGGPEAESPDQATRHQDTFRKVLLGQVSDPIFPASAQQAQVGDEELARQALQDRGGRMRSHSLAFLPLWRWLSVVLLGSIALLLVLR